MTTNVTYSDLHTLVVEENKPVLTISRELGCPTSVVWALLHQHNLEEEYKEQSTKRFYALESSYKNQSMSQYQRSIPTETTSDVVALSQGKILPGHTPYKLGVADHTIPRPVLENDWEIVEEIKALINQGHKVEQLLAKAGLPEWKIELYLIQVADLSSPERRECLRHGTSSPVDASQQTDDSTYLLEETEE